MLEVGRIAKAHGIRGEVIVALVTDRTERVAVGSVLTTASGRALDIVRSRPQPQPDRFIVAFAGVATRDDAEALRGELLYAEPIEDESVLWIHELIGSEVVDAAGTRLGRVEAVEANPASDLLVLETGGLIPLRFVVDHAPGRLVVDLPDGLLE
ncbi:MAG TPA: ribosome maturation factor RimM [Acidimicrobiales bacterium]|nr:ribosome maturation factor RimM [Acidimicrobiales bacterium]